tara:strand:+ start:278 stop:745 length:468 start_codon:yes stop_codon:yes gene_type:complete
MLTSVQTTTKILLIANSPSDASMFREKLSELNGTLGDTDVTTVPSLDEAEELIGQDTAVFIDLHLRGCNQNTALNFVRKHKRKHPVVIYSLVQDKSVIKKFGKYGIGYLVKGEHTASQIAFELWRAQGAVEMAQARREAIDESHRIISECQRQNG